MGTGNVSAGILLYRRDGDGLEVLIAHPGGPFWKGRDAGAWTIPKGLVEAGEIVGVGVRDHLLVASAEQWVSLHRRHPWCGVQGWRRPSSVQEPGRVARE